MSLNVDDSMISGIEFKLRRFAIGLEQPLIQEQLGVKRAAIDKWQRGDVQVPRRARELLETCEADVDAMVADFVERMVQVLPPEPPARWPWSEQTWFVVVGRARHELAKVKVEATIGEPVEGRVVRQVQRERTVPKRRIVG